MRRRTVHVPPSDRITPTNCNTFYWEARVYTGVGPHPAVHGARGLYVLDGALIPGTTAACNPSMTIAAVAERALERIVAEDVGSII